MRKRLIDDDTTIGASLANIQSVYKELNYPSSDKLKRVLKARNIPFDAKHINGLTRDDPVRAVQAPPYKFNGKIAANDLDDRWFMDLIDFTATPSDGGKKLAGLNATTTGVKYILVVQDVFSRKIWAESLTDKRPPTVADGLKRIFSRTNGRKPRSITTDAGAEFSKEFETYVESLNNILHFTTRNQSIQTQSQQLMWPLGN